MREALADANILVRYLTDEPRDMADRAAALLEAAERSDVSVAVASVTVAETVYVLRAVYKWDRREICSRLLEIIDGDVVSILEHDAIVQALIWFRDLPGVHFADAYLAALSSARHGSAIISFDRRMQRIPGIAIVAAPTEFLAD